MMKPSTLLPSLLLLQKYATLLSGTVPLINEIA